MPISVEHDVEGAPAEAEPPRGDEGRGVVRGDDAHPLRWVTVARFSCAEEAHIARLVLESDDIPCFVADEQMVSNFWQYSIALGGIKVNVPEQDSERALALLHAPSVMSAIDPTLAPGQVARRCGQCHSPYIYRQSTPLRIFLLLLLLGQVFSLAVVHQVVGLIALAGWCALLLITPIYRCQQCGCEWTDPADAPIPDSLPAPARVTP